MKEKVVWVEGDEFRVKSSPGNTYFGAIALGLKVGDTVEYVGGWRKI